MVNKSEDLVKQFLTRKGFRVIKNGWPDFLCLKRTWHRNSYSDEFTGVMTVEVKNGKDKLSKEQELVHSVLNAAGVPVYTIRPEMISDLENKIRQKETARLFLTSDELKSLVRSINEMKARVSDLEKILDSSVYMFDDNSNCFTDTIGINDRGGFIIKEDAPRMKSGALANPADPGYPLGSGLVEFDAENKIVPTRKVGWKSDYNDGALLVAPKAEDE